ncbi:hypothetical protein ACFL9U_12275 [Thermodesulfobacteriota bacterium]
MHFRHKTYALACRQTRVLTCKNMSVENEKTIFLICIFLTLIYPTGCRNEVKFSKTHPSLETNQEIYIKLIPEKSEYYSRDVPSGAVAFYASIENHGNSPITIAHPTICLPADYRPGETFDFKKRHGKSEILLSVIKPDGKTLILRDGPYYFDPDKIDRFTIHPGESRQFYVGWFFQNARGRWENDIDAANLFLKKGGYKATLLYRNFFPQAAIYDSSTNNTRFIKVWTGEILSNEVVIKIK